MVAASKMGHGVMLNMMTFVLYIDLNIPILRTHSFSSGARKWVVKGKLDAIPIYP